jgi:hypothetical protein
MKISFEKKDGYIHFKIKGEFKESKDFSKIKNLGEISKKYGFSTILVDVIKLNYNFDTLKRFQLSEYWVKICRDLGFIKTAILGNEDKMDKLSENVIINRGFDFRLFTDEKLAVDWLKN